jgi:hypothetical protein
MFKQNINHKEQMKELEEKIFMSKSVMQCIMKDWFNSVKIQFFCNKSLLNFYSEPVCYYCFVFDELTSHDESYFYCNNIHCFNLCKIIVVNKYNEGTKFEVYPYCESCCDSITNIKLYNRCINKPIKTQSRPSRIRHRRTRSESPDRYDADSDTNVSAPISNKNEYINLFNNLKLN